MLCDFGPRLLKLRKEKILRSRWWLNVQKDLTQICDFQIQCRENTKGISPFRD